jgi:nucleoid DNA-binding protein
MKGDTVNHSEVMLKLSQKTGIPIRALREVFDVYADVVIECCAEGRRVVMKDIGTIKVVDTPARMGRNVVEGTPLPIPAGKRVKMVAHKTLKNAILN